ncbi:MAG TPA: hypothetical protein VMG30_05815 [Acidobacteriota bacterium]|nr:hypothetical protein [Acidobacteriota bacterium]
MKGKRIVTLLSLVFMLALALSISSTLVAGEKGEKDESAHPAGGTWLNIDNYGTISISTESPIDANGRSWNMTTDFVNFNYTFAQWFPPYGLAPNAAPVQQSSYGQGFMTGPDTYENSFIFFCKNNDGSLAYVMIAIGKGRFLDANNSITNFATYWFVPGALGPFHDANNDGIPDDTWGSFESDIVATSQRLSTAVPSLPAPLKYPHRP